MQKVVLADDNEVIPELTRMGLPRDTLLDIFDRAAGERANVNGNDPAATGGVEMRRWLTRFLRESTALQERGWVACAHNKLEGIRNDRLRLKLVSLNTNAAAGMLAKMPISVAEKGPAVEKVIQGNFDRMIGDLFGEELKQPIDPIDEYDYFNFCVHVSDKQMSAEISRPVGLTAGFVTDYSLRIILLRPGDKPGLVRPETVPEDFADVGKPIVARKA